MQQIGRLRMPSALGLSTRLFIWGHSPIYLVDAFGGLAYFQGVVLLLIFVPLRTISISRLWSYYFSWCSSGPSIFWGCGPMPLITSFQDQHFFVAMVLFTNFFAGRITSWPNHSSRERFAWSYTPAYFISGPSPYFFCNPILHILTN